MTAITVQNGSLVLRDGKIGTGQDCCCEPEICGSSCSGNGLPQSLVFSITSCTISASDLTFDPVDDWTIDLLSSCESYGAQFFPNNPGVYVCFPPVCFTGCAYKLSISLALSVSGGPYGVRVIIADINPNTNIEIGGDAYDTTYRGTEICNRSFPFSGSLTTGCGGFSLDYTVDEA